MLDALAVFAPLPGTDKSLSELLKDVRPATPEELKEQAESLGRNYTPGPRQACPFVPATDADVAELFAETRRERSIKYCDDRTADAINKAVRHIHDGNVLAGWWKDLKTGESTRGKRNVPELLALVHSEISEALEGHRKNLMDDKLPHREMFEVELADAVIRILDIAGGFDLDLGGAVAEKLQFNRIRADHKVENRLTENGKKY